MALKYVFFFPKNYEKSKCVIFFKVTKIAIFSKRKITIIIEHGHGDFALAPEPRCFFFIAKLELTYNR